VSYCETLTQLPDISGLITLRTLNVSRCKLLTELPDISGLTALHTLNVSFCNLLTQLPDISSLMALEDLAAAGCSGLTSLTGLGNLTSLCKLDIRDCNMPKVLDLGGLRPLGDTDSDERTEWGHSDSNRTVQVRGAGFRPALVAADPGSDGQGEVCGTGQATRLSEQGTLQCF
jgi:hypothetical protein